MSKYFEEDIIDQDWCTDSYISDDSVDNPDYVFDQQMEEEVEELEAEYFGLLPPPPHADTISSTAGPSRASTSTSSAPSSPPDWLYAPSTRKKSRESRSPSSCGRQQPSVVPSDDAVEVASHDLDSVPTHW